MTANKLSYTIFETVMGWVGIVGSPKGLIASTLPKPTSQEVQSCLSKHMNNAVYSPDSFKDLVNRFNEYFNGNHVVFPDKLYLENHSLFKRNVWEAASNIPYGETRSYSWIAEKTGKYKAQRAVGQALGENPLPVIIPCHRVIAANGQLGGFTGGVEMKRRLLQIEARPF